MSRTQLKREKSETKSRCLIIKLKWSISREKTKAIAATITIISTKHQQIQMLYGVKKKYIIAPPLSTKHQRKCVCFFLVLNDWMILTTSRSYIFPNIYIDYFVDVFNCSMFIYIQYLCICVVLCDVLQFYINSKIELLILNQFFLQLWLANWEFRFAYEKCNSLFLNLVALIFKSRFTFYDKHSIKFLKCCS